MTRKQLLLIALGLALFMVPLAIGGLVLLG